MASRHLQSPYTKDTVLDHPSL